MTCAPQQATIAFMEQKAVKILDQYRLMTIATLRADGWPQATMVNYANEGLLLYFIISRQSQKFANIARDSRVSIMVGRDFDDPSQIKALSGAANASEVGDPAQRERPRRGVMFVISSPSGAGKTTLCRRLISEVPGVELSVSATTRSPRPGETDDVDYHFKSVAQFEDMIDRDEFLEWAKVFKNFYGTPRSEVEAPNVVSLANSSTSVLNAIQCQPRS